MTLKHIGKCLHQVAALNLAAFTLTRIFQSQDRSHLAQDDTFQVIEIALTTNQGKITNNLMPDQNRLHNTC